MRDHNQEVEENQRIWTLHPYLSGTVLSPWSLWPGSSSFFPSALLLSPSSPPPPPPASLPLLFFLLSHSLSVAWFLNSTSTLFHIWPSHPSFKCPYKPCFSESLFQICKKKNQIFNSVSVLQLHPRRDRLKSPERGLAISALKKGSRLLSHSQKYLLRVLKSLESLSPGEDGKKDCVTQGGRLSLCAGPNPTYSAHQEGWSGLWWGQPGSPWL